MNNEQVADNPVVTFFKKFISFDSFITPVIIKVIFWLMIVFILLSGLGTIISGFSNPYGYNQWLITYGLLYIVLGALMTKIFCEVLIVLFKINENLKEIAYNTKK